MVVVLERIRWGTRDVMEGEKVAAWLLLPALFFVQCTTSKRPSGATMMSPLHVLRLMSNATRDPGSMLLCMPEHAKESKAEAYVHGWS